jgi:type I restriction enzyme M protein
MLVRYELARPALKRAGDDRPAKEERDVLFIERIVKMLRPGGRAAIVLPQGKFNNSSLGFIREWILQKARLLAVVGLHPNTFKPHTGTKTSVIFLQKYTPEQQQVIVKIHNQVAQACPDFEKEIKSLINQFRELKDVPDSAVPEGLADLMIEAFGERENQVGDTELTTESIDQNQSTADDDRIISSETTLSDMEEKRTSLASALKKANEELERTNREISAVMEKDMKEIAEIRSKWEDTKVKLKIHLTAIKESQRATLAALKHQQKKQQKDLKLQIRAMENELTRIDYDLKRSTNRGRLTLILEDSDLVGQLKERWIAATVAKQLDYQIFMAVSERGGKDNSGDYQFVVDQEGIVEFPIGHPQEGQPVVDQDLVNFHIRPGDLTNGEVADKEVRIAEAFIRFAKEQKLEFWKA